MRVPPPNDAAGEDPLARLERAFIEEFLQRRGYTPAMLQELPDDQAHALRRDASLYASGRLTEVESRSHFVNDIHDAARAASGPTHGRKG